MKRKENRPTFSSFKCLRPHLDDIEQIIQLLEENGFSVAVSDSDYVYEDLAEVPDKRGTRLKRLELDAQPPEGTFSQRLSIDFKNGRAYLHRSIGSPETDVIWYRLQEILRDRHAWWLNVFNPWTWGGVWTGLVFNTTILGANFQSKTFIIINLFLIAFCSVMLGVSTFIANRGKVIILERRYEASFWNKNRDKIILLAIGTLAGAALTILSNLLISYLP